MTTITDERLAEMVGAGVPCVPAQPGEIAAVVQELRAIRSKPVAGVEVKPTNAAEWVLVPPEPTIEMMSAAMDKMGTWIAPYTSPRECGVPTGNDISMAEATMFNTAQMDDYAVTYRAMISAAPKAVAEMTEANACMAAIDELRREEGDQVSILCDNPDFNGQPNNAVVISAGWTNWQDFRVSGHTLRQALENAVAIKAMAPADGPASAPVAEAQPEAVITEEMRAEALRLLKARDERDDKVQEIIEDLREIVLMMPAASRPDGLFKHAQDAVYAMRGRTRLMDDAALTAALKEA